VIFAWLAFKAKEMPSGQFSPTAEQFSVGNDVPKCDELRPVGELLGVEGEHFAVWKFLGGKNFLHCL